AHPGGGHARGPPQPHAAAASDRARRAGRGCAGRVGGGRPPFARGPPRLARGRAAHARDVGRLLRLAAAGSVELHPHSPRRISPEIAGTGPAVPSGRSLIIHRPAEQVFRAGVTAPRRERWTMEQTPHTTLTREPRTG